MINHKSRSLKKKLVLLVYYNYLKNQHKLDEKEFFVILKSGRSFFSGGIFLKRERENAGINDDEDDSMT